MMGGTSYFNEIVSAVTGSIAGVLVLGNVSNEIKDILKKLGCRVEHADDIDELASSRSFSLIISCDLFTKNEDKFIRLTLEKVLNHLELDGSFAFCETCFHEAAGTKADCHVRGPTCYSSCVESVAISTLMEDGTEVNYAFEITLSKALEHSPKVFWLVTKVKSINGTSFAFNTFQEFLNKNQYSQKGILKYEKIFGDGFISTGGIDTTQEFVGLLKLKKDEHVLDVGSGIGGGAFYMSQNQNVSVTGIDLSANIVAIALERMNSRKIPNVSFEVCDATKRYFPEEAFDVVYSRDTILHILDKRSLFSKFLKWLKPGGRLLITDYCCSDGDWSDDFDQYVKQRGYFLLSVQNYGKLLEEVGFTGVKAEDRTKQFVEMLQKELKRISNNKESFLKDFSMDDYDSMITGWQDKLRRCAEGHQRWGLFYAEKI